MAAAEPLTNPLQKQASSEDMEKNLIETIKRKFGEDRYQSFLDTVLEYQDKKTSLQKLLEQMADLLSDEPDLIKELSQLLPDGISMLKVDEKKPSGVAPKPRSRWLSGFDYVIVGGFGVTLGIWAHLLF